MYTEFSHYFLFLTIFTIISFISLQKYYVALRALKRSHRIIYWMISFYFLIFTSCFYFTLMSYACSDFSFYSILTNCSLQSPLFYKISATWSNHEGSLLLWCWLLSFCGFIFCIRTRSAKQENRISKRQIIRTEQYVNDISQAGAKRYIEEQRQIIVRSTIIMTIIIFFFATFLVYTSNPFLKILFPSIYSIAELNPVLQDPVLAIHPPCIYLGYVASAISFSLCLAIIRNKTKSKLFLVNFFFQKLIDKKLDLLYKKTITVPLDSRGNAGGERIVGCGAGLQNNIPKFYIERENLHHFLKALRIRSADRFCSLSRRGAKLEEAFLKTLWNKLQLWTLVCWSFLTLGIMLGSWWAYHELGWGGWWFWDPVENASLMPWLLVTAGLHTVSKKEFVITTCTLSLGTFILSILGTFFVRSGLLTSVHSFATDSTRGLYLLIFLISIIVISLVSMYKYKMNQKMSPNLKTSNKVGVLRIQNLFFCVICAVILCGTCAPIFFQWFFNRDVSTGTSFYNSTLIPLFTSILFGLVYLHYREFKQNFNSKMTTDLVTLVEDLQGSKSITPKNFFFATTRYSSGLPFVRRALSSLKNSLHLTRTNIGYALGFSIILFASCQLSYLKSLGLTNLGSIYGTLCVFLISSILLSQKKIHNATYDNAKVSKFQPSKLIGLCSLTSVKRTFPMILAHIGVVVFIVGVQLSNSMKIQMTQLLYYGDLIRIGSHICSIRGIDHSYAPSSHSLCGNLIIYKQDLISMPTHPSIKWLEEYQAQRANGKRNTLADKGIDLQKNSDPLAAFQAFKYSKANVLHKSRVSAPDNVYDCFCLFPEKRFFYLNPQLNITKVAIHTNLFTDFYALIGTGSLEAGWYTTIMKLPFIFCIWLGFLFGAIGGILGFKRVLQKYKLNWL